MALKHSVYDTDTHFLINPTTRAFYNESPSKNTIIQYDHNSERITFEIPRQIEGHDISLCDVIQVHYNNINAVTKEQNCGVYAVEDMQISPDDENIVILSWLVSGNATKHVGSLNFLIRFACSADDGTLYYVWNTAIYSGISISAGIYNGDVIAEEYADILAQWEKELMDAGGEGVNKVEEAQNNALAEIERKKQEALEEVDRNTAFFSNSLKGYKSGTAIALTDISPLEHILRVKARSENVDVSTAKLIKMGKNFIPYPFYEDDATKSGVQFTQNKSTLVLNGTAEEDIVFYLKWNDSLRVPKGYYAISGASKGTSDNTCFIGVLCSKDGATAYYPLFDGNHYIAEIDTINEIYVVVKAGTVLNNVVLKPQIELNTNATEFEPYEEPTLHSINPDGVVEGVTSLYPTTTLIPDTEGVVLDAEYNRDINKAFAELHNAIISLGGNV